MSRLLTDFEDRRWIVRDGPTFELTRLGEFVADRFLNLCEAMEVERKLRDVWQWLPREMEGFSADLFADAVVSYPGPKYSYPSSGSPSSSKEPATCVGSTVSYTNQLTTSWAVVHVCPRGG